MASGIRELSKDIILKIEGTNVVIMEEKKPSTVLGRFPLTQLANNPVLSSKNLDDAIKNITGYISIEVSFCVEESDPYLYGDDADGNRGIMVSDIEDATEDNSEIEALSLVLIYDNEEDIEIDSDEIQDLDNLLEIVLEDINSNMSDYL